MTLGIVTSRTVRSYSRRPSWPYVLNPDSPQADGLQLWCPGDPAGGGRMYDLKKGNHGQFQNSYPSANSPTWTGTGDGSNALCVKGNTATTNYVNFGQMGFANPSSTFAWIQPASVSIGDTRYWAPNTGATAGAIRQVNATFEALNTAGSAWNTVVTGLTTDWQHTGVIFTAAGSCTGYRNGAVGTTVASTTPLMWQSQSWTFGANYAGFGAYFGCSFYDLRVYNIEVPQNVIEQMWDGNTRWDLYYQPGLRSWLLPSTTVATGRFNAAWSAGNKLIGGGIC